MVLNLLNSRTLADAKAFLDMSFGNFLGEKPLSHFPPPSHTHPAQEYLCKPPPYLRPCLDRDTAHGCIPYCQAIQKSAQMSMHVSLLSSWAYQAPSA